MLFNSFPFLFGFLPLCILGYFALARWGSALLANVYLAIASLVFYGYWPYEAPDGTAPAARHFGFVALLCGSTCVNYFWGLRLRARHRWAELALAVSANLAVLAWFKYSGFGVQIANALFHAHFAPLRVILPLAISFYTFTQIAYLVDCYRGLATELSFWRYCLFVFFFPHLIAGPIVHHAELMPQFAAPAAKRWHPENASAALCWLSLGLFKKVAIADSFAPLANYVFGHSAEMSCLEAWAGALAYAFQLYFDFSGYSDMAIGLSLFFNVRLPDNFNAPYRAADIVDFWRRWHITLSRFLRDYLYIPLGGNRLGGFRRYFNLFVTMLLGGLWHGAGWTFVIWGAYHGALLIGCHLWKGLGQPLPAVVSRPLTFLAVLAGWVVFRAPTRESAGEILRALVDFHSLRLHELSAPVQLEHLVALVGVLIFTQLAPTTKTWIETRELTWPRAIPIAGLFCVALLLIRDVHLQFAKSEFIYFQF